VRVRGRVGETVGERGMWVGIGGFKGEQAENPLRSTNSIAIRFIA
jgi:hypothetical protein